MPTFTDYLYDYMFDNDQYVWIVIYSGKAELIMDIPLLDC
jgi:hypothetical protein